MYENCSNLDAAFMRSHGPGSFFFLAPATAAAAILALAVMAGEDAEVWKLLVCQVIWFHFGKYRRYIRLTQTNFDDSVQMYQLKEIYEFIIQK